MLAVRSLPTPAEIRQAAADGDPSAIARLPELVKMEARRARAEASELKLDSPLPEVVGDKVRFEWDIKDDGDRWTIIRANDVVIWTELAYWEGFARFDAVKAILRDRFEGRFDGLHPTDASKGYLYGDVLSARVTPF